MARGGYRPGAGRPKLEPALKEARRAARKEGVTPLRYMLRTMNDPSVDEARRDRMAIAAAPFCHPRADAVMGKKARAAEDAQTAGEGTDWGDDLTETVN
jgi:hypothetical protein